MKNLAVIFLIFLSGATAATTTVPARFQALDVFIEPAGQPLAAYEVDIRAASGDATIVGIEGGQPPAFSAAPYYDPAALNHGHVIIAAFSLDDAHLPTGKTRVATIHIYNATGAALAYETKLVIAGTTTGQPITAQVSTAVESAGG